MGNKNDFKKKYNKMIKELPNPLTKIKIEAIFK